MQLALLTAHRAAAALEHVYEMVPPQGGIGTSPGTFSLLTPTAVELLKGYSAYKLFREFPYLRKRYFWGGHLWSPSYFFRSVGPATLEVMQNYVRNQGQPVPPVSSVRQTKLTSLYILSNSEHAFLS